MLKNIKFLLLALLSVACSKSAPKPYGVLPTKQQVEWQKMEMNMFCHFGPNTFSGEEWGSGKEDVGLFAPTQLDCNQWVKIAEEAGFKGIILTAKHHDGFSLWPNPETVHSVAQSKWRDGKGDVLKEFSEACSKSPVKFGIYISPWDRNHPTYGTPEYNQVFKKTLDHALTNYGEVFEQWFDGACGEGPNGKKQVYDWDLFNSTVYKHQSNAIIFSDRGPGCRWVGNENGFAGRTSWSPLDITKLKKGQSPDLTSANEGNKGGNIWVPSESDVSIRKGWFWRKSEDSTVKSLEHLLEIYYKSVGRNSLLLLNVPPDNRGLLPAVDSARLMEFRHALDKIFAVNYAQNYKSIDATNQRGRKFAIKNILDDNYDSYWAIDDEITQASFTLEFAEAQSFNRVLIQEYIPLGQRVEAFSVEILDENGEWIKIANETTIGYKRIVLLEHIVSTKAVRINIEKSLACPIINNFGLYLDEFYKASQTE